MFLLLDFHAEMHDRHLISTYSVKGYETLNPEFVDYLNNSVEVTPYDCPLVLNIIGNCLSQEDKETIKEIIRDDFAYHLGMVERKEKKHARIFVFMFLGLALSGLLLWFTKALAEEPRELLFIPFWFMGETLCDYIFLTERDVEQLYSEIEKDVKETITEEDLGE